MLLVGGAHQDFQSPWPCVFAYLLLPLWHYAHWGNDEGSTRWERLWETAGGLREVGEMGGRGEGGVEEEGERGESRGIGKEEGRRGKGGGREGGRRRGGRMGEKGKEGQGSRYHMQYNCFHFAQS